VKSLTTDPNAQARFKGRYQITKEQLVEEIGNPTIIANNYIASVSKRIPSFGLKLLTSLLIVVFSLTIIVGIERTSVGFATNFENSGWLINTGIALSVCGFLSIGILLLSLIRFDQYHYLISYLILSAIILSVPISIFLAGYITKSLEIEMAVALQNTFGVMIIIDVVIIGLIGLYIYLNHYRVMIPNADLMI
jgi:hypothetical protein